MSIYKPKNSPYFHFDFQWKGQRFFGSTGCGTKRAAVEYERRERHKAVMGLEKLPDLTVDEACGLYAEHADKQPSWATARYMLRELVAGLGKHKMIAEVTQRDLQVYFARRRDGRSNATVNREIENCRAVWRKAECAGFDCGKMPNWTRLMLKVPKTDPRELSLTEEPALFSELRADLIDVCDFALKSGWRKSEVMGLRWIDCDLTAMQAKTKIKGGNTVKRPLTPTLLAIIANQPKVGPFVFTYICHKNNTRNTDKLGRVQPGRKVGERYPMTATALRRPWALAKKLAGIEDFRFHDLRHTRGTRIVRATGSLAAAKSALQHTDIKTTLRYAHVLDDDVRDALDASESRTIPGEASRRRKKG